MRVVVELVRDCEANVARIATTTSAPTRIHNHGTVVVVVLFVTLVDVSLVVPVESDGFDPVFGAVIEELPLAPGLVLVVVVVLDVPAVPVLCAKLITGATLRKTTRSRTLRRMIVRIDFSHGIGST
jgi:hypothetical protein